MTDDGVPIDAIHLAHDGDLAVVLAHGFTLSWQHGAVWKVARRLNRSAGVIAFDFRGHGRSGGKSTLGDRETRDLGVAVAYARELGYRRIAAVGFSMGASIVVRYAGLVGGIDAAVSVSGPGRWYYRGTYPMRRVHWAVERRVGRLVTRTWLNTRVTSGRWDPVPMPPAEAAARDLTDPVPGRARRQGSVLPRRARAPAVRGRPRAEGAVGGARVRSRRIGLERRPGRPHRRLGAAGDPAAAGAGRGGRRRRRRSAPAPRNRPHGALPVQPFYLPYASTSIPRAPGRLCSTWPARGSVARWLAVMPSQALVR